MTWHGPHDIPPRDQEVLAEVEGFVSARFVVLKFSDGYWWQHLPSLGGPMINDGWIGIAPLKVRRWMSIPDFKVTAREYYGN